MTLPRGTPLGPYEIADLLGRGGMGEVYRAVDARLGREVAVKVLPAETAGHEESLARFRREARAIAALSHPNIVAIFDIGTHDGLPYVVTELLSGETLRARLQRGAMPLEEMLRVSRAIAEGLAAAHEKGIIHRDLKPENIFLTSSGAVKILDFGLASALPFGNSPLTDAAMLTEPGMVIGTVGYMSPEQLRGAPLTTAADIFPFGCLAYEMLAGEMPFQRDSNMEVIAAVLRDDPPPLEMPADLREVLDRCLEKSAAKRIQNGSELAAALREISAAGPSSALRAPSPRTRGEGRWRERWQWWLILLFPIAALVGGYFITERRRVVDEGYDLRAGDITGSADTRRLTALALGADAAGDRAEAIELCHEAVRLDSRAPLPAAFLSSFVYYGRDQAEGMRWYEEVKRRLPASSSTYETLLCRYLMPENDNATAMALSSSLLELRPKAWRLRLSLAHLHMDRREMAADLAQLMQIDVSAPDDRRLALVLADRASLGDIDGAIRDLRRSRLMARPPLLAYTEARIAWSRGQAAEAARLYDLAAERATIANQTSIAVESRVLAGVARVGAGRLDDAQAALDSAAVSAHAASIAVNELEAYGFGAYVAQRLGDIDGMERRLQRAFAVQPAGSADWALLRLFAVRMHAKTTPPRVPLRTGGDVANGLATLVLARDAWAGGDTANAARLLRQSRSEGIGGTWFAEEAALLDYDLGAPPRAFKPDPPYPNRLRIIAAWELSGARK